MFSSISEDFIHYVWRTLNFNQKDLYTKDGQKIEIIQVGRQNHDQGPDFLNACIRIGDIEWHGQVELHLRSQDWYRHKHHEDEYYNNTILHVVLEQGDRKITREDGTNIPEISLSGRIQPDLLKRYDKLRLAQDTIPCAFAIHQLSEIHISSWVDRLAIERMEQKAAQMQENLSITTQDWEQILWEELAAMIGGPVNQDAMRETARRIPVKILKKYKTDLQKLEALLFGASGMLISETPFEAYYQTLRKEWNFLKVKHQLETSPVDLRFLRMRPAAFPSIRLAQLAAVFREFDPLIQLVETGNFSAFINRPIQARNYWDLRFRFGAETSKSQIKRLGKSQKEILIINCLIPFALIYHRAHGREDTYAFIEEGLSNLSAEHNRHTRVFEQLKVKNKHAMHSQGLIQLKKYYCDQKNCLKCAIGHQVLKG